ncbi:MAG: hypothetical protein JG781_1187 [Peptococcaceae bacterium]|nr:hypothetical protein [Peptococcaceae bacterium]
MQDIARRSLLFDFYGQLLTKKQQEIYDLYFQQDLSLGEIAELHRVSRQAIYDLLRRTEETLEEYENKLGLVRKHNDNTEILKQVEERLENIQEKYGAHEIREVYTLLKKMAEA